jgi:DNA-binding CsgD family transcriptional regulator
METGIELVQQVQDAFACQCKLTLFLLDLEGKEVTSPSEVNNLAMMLRNENSRIDEWVKNINDVSVFDAYPGLKVILSPVKAMGEIKYFIWAGVIVENESRLMLYEYLDKNMDFPSTWKSALDELPDTTNDQKHELIGKMKALSATIGKLIDHDQKDWKGQQVIKGLIQVSGLIVHDDGFPEIIREFINMNSDLDFVGFAAASAEGCSITHISGGEPYNSLVGSNFSLGEGFIGHVMASGLMRCWNNINLDPRNAFFIAKNIHPHFLVCYPVHKDKKVSGVLFGGSCRKKEMDPPMLEIGKVVANILGVYLTKKELRSSMVLQLQRLNALMEICQLTLRVQDVKRIAFLLVDMSINIVHGKFAAITLFDLETSPDEVRIVSRGLSTDQSEKYGKLLLYEYGEGLKGGRDYPASPIVRDFDGMKVCECPIYNQKVHGVLSAALTQQNEDQMAFLSCLASIGAIAINQANRTQNETSLSVTYLHQAMSQWDRSSYDFTIELRERVLSFSEYLNLPSIDRNALEQACLLSYYEPDFLSGILDDSAKISKIIKDYKVLSGRKAKEEIPSDEYAALGPEGQIMSLAAEYIRSNGSLQISKLPVEERLREKFYSFIQRSEILDQQISLKEHKEIQFEQLSSREQEVAGLLVKGLNNKQIASKLFISEHTVKNHITNIFQKLGVHDRAGVMAYFYNRKMEK